MAQAASSAEDMKTDAMEEIASVLNRPEIQTATITVLSKMPSIAKAVSLVDLAVDLVEPMVSDEELLGMMMQFLPKIQKYLNTETLHATVDLIDKLPFLLKALNLAELVGDLVGPLIKDEEFVSELARNATKAIEPFNQSTVQAGRYIIEKIPLVVRLASLVEIAEDLLEPLSVRPDFIKDVRDRANQNTSRISPFQLLKLTKHSEVQNVLHRIVAFLDVLSESKEAR